MGHLIIDGGYPYMIETFEAVDVVALKNLVHTSIFALSFFSI